MASVALGFPYCPNEPIRAEAFELVTGYYARHFPNLPQYDHSATAIGEPFQRSRSRNQLVALMEAAGHDLLVLIDADTLIHPDGIHQMLKWVAAGPMRLGKPFHRGVNLPLSEQILLADGKRSWPAARFNDPGAAWVIRPADWWTAGGMDENFTTWGGEDSAFSYLFAARGGTEQTATFAAVKTEHDQPRWSQIPGWRDTLRRELVTKHVWKHPNLAAEWLAVRDEDVLDEWAERCGVESDPRLARLRR